MAEEKENYGLTSFDYVVVEKNKLLETLRENRGNHQSIYDASVSGFWIQAKETLVEKSGQFQKALGEANFQFDKQYSDINQTIESKKKDDMKNFYISFGFPGNFNLQFPVNHLNDYDRVISMLEFSVADKVKLTSTDFESYVRNNWSWKKDFGTTSFGYLNKLNLMSGYCATDALVNRIMGSGML